MALKFSEVSKMGYQKQALLLANQLQANHREAMMKSAEEWAALPGVKVNYSFFQNKEKNDFNRDEIAKALSDLGVDIKNVKGKKWYQFSKDKWNTKLLNAIKQIIVND